MSNFLAEVEPHTHPIHPLQFPLLILQVLVAVVTVVVAKRYYDRTLLNADRTHKVQNSDAFIRHKAEYERSGDKLRKICGEAYTAALDGTKKQSLVKLANERLDLVSGSLPDLRLIVNGIPGEPEMVVLVQKLEESIHEYGKANMTSDPHAGRVRICEAIRVCTNDLKEKWDEGTSSRLKQFGPDGK